MNQLQQAEFDARLEKEKLEALKELAYGAGHEINNPLANIAARAQSLLLDEMVPERRRKLVAIHRQAMRAHEMIADLMLFARPPKLKPAPCQLQTVVKGVVNELGDLATERTVSLTFRDASNEPILVTADETQLAVAIHAVVNNALEAAPGGNVTVEVGVDGDGTERWAETRISDDGPGISPEIRAHMFDPFFSGREAGRGLGFGLSKCWRIVTDHGGRVVVREPKGRGATISILLPVGR
jgi:signal transduction histidine kinase